MRWIGGIASRRKRRWQWYPHTGGGQEQTLSWKPGWRASAGMAGSEPGSPGTSPRAGVAGMENRPQLAPPWSSPVNRRRSTVNRQNPPGGLCGVSNRPDAMFQRRLTSGRAFRGQNTAAPALAGRAGQGPPRWTSPVASARISIVLAFCPCSFGSDSYNHRLD